MPPARLPNRPTALCIARGLGRLGHGLAASAVFAALAAAAGCGTVAAAGQSSGSQEFVDDIVAQLSSASTVAYTAVYALPGGGTATIAQEPATGRTSYTYPAGMTLETSSDATVCVAPASGARATTCSIFPSVDAAAPEIAKGGVIRTESLITMLSTAALDHDAIVSEHDATIAGTSATCVMVDRGEGTSSTYDACVTTDGLLASFRGEWDGGAVDMTMVSYTKSADAGAFTLPAGAKVTPAATQTAQP